jgi:acyl carrier protein
MEATVAAIFAEVLGRDAVSVTESFFALGGHSVLFFTLITACRARFGVALSAKDVLSALTARELAVLIASRIADGGEQA